MRLLSNHIAALSVIAGGIATGAIAGENTLRSTPQTVAERLAQLAEECKQSENFDATGFNFDIAPGPVTPDLASFERNYSCPEWFRNAKFGIYMHWGLNSLPGMSGHYARNMYHQAEPEISRFARENNVVPTPSGYGGGAEKIYSYHVQTFGHPSKFGYKDFIPLWKTDKFDAETLTAFYKECGARYIGVMAVHHDNFDLYDSIYQPWNSVNMGPKVDIVGAWKQACARQGLRFAITSHLSNNRHEHIFYQGEADSTGPLARVPYDTMDPRNDGLYGKRTQSRLYRLNPGFAQSWYRRTKQLIDKYDPDMLYLDGGLPNGAYGLNLAAHFYNHCRKVDGKPDAVFTIKQRTPGFTFDVESALVGEKLPNPWQVDTTINRGWFYMGGDVGIPVQAKGGTDDAGMTSARPGKKPEDVRLSGDQVILNLIDIVSKNGNLLLNVGLRADGSLPEEYRVELRKIGNWLRVNGEAIYDTRPFQDFGEGPHKFPIGSGYNDNQMKFTAQDVRFTVAKDGSALYATVLGHPDTPTVIKALRKDFGGIASITLLGSQEKIAWQQEAEALMIQPVATWPHATANTFKIVGAAPISHR